MSLKCLLFLDPFTYLLSPFSPALSFGDGTQGLTYGRQALLLLSYIPSLTPLFKILFSTKFESSSNR